MIALRILAAFSACFALSSAITHDKVALRAVSLKSGASYGNPKCPCVGFDNVEGTTVVSLDKTTTHPYPADLGARCEAWDNNRHPTSCKDSSQDPGLDKGWCADAWCYVDPCNCDIPVEPKTSAYLPDATYQSKPVYYSYATCGAKDQWTEKHHTEACVNQKSAADCMSLPKCAWNGNRCAGKEIMGQCSKKMHGFTWGMASCRCVGIDGQPGTLDMDVDGKGTMVAYPADTGATCKAWDQNQAPDCKKKDAPKWCFQKWCYVDPCSCGMKTPPKTSAYLPGAKFQGKSVYYSYETCGGVDHYTEDFHKKACVNQKSKDSCVALKSCGWTGTECLGKEVAEECGAPEEPAKPKKSGAWAPVPLVAAAMLTALQA